MKRQRVTQRIIIVVFQRLKVQIVECAMFYFYLKMVLCVEMHNSINRNNELKLLIKTLAII